MFTFCFHKSASVSLLHYAVLNVAPLRSPAKAAARRSYWTISSMNAKSQTSDAESKSFYQYTSGRWLWNEDAQLAVRYVKFNIKELCCIAAASVGSTSCTDVTKLTEGNFNKVLLLTTDDGKEVIAKIPNPNAGYPHFLTASEVATNGFSPKVYTWCAKADETPVGAEYIVMEKSPGIKLSHVWDDMHVLKKSEIVTQLVRFDASLASNPLPAYGSLYYAQDANGDKFAVGPTNNRKYFDDGRATLPLDHGPWDSVEQYVLANARREKQSIINLPPSRRLQGLFNGPGQYQPSRKTKLRALDCYMKVARHLLPKITETHRPVLWHPDLHGDNSFVDPDNPTKITGIIDWQAAHIAPLFLQVRRPGLLDFDGPIPERMKPPKRPENFDQLSPDEKAGAKKLHAAQAMHVLYEIELLQQCREAGQALRGRETLVGRLAGLVGSIFDDGEPIVLGLLMQAVDRWTEIVGQDPDEYRPRVPCPIHFTNAERAQQRADQTKWEEGVKIMDEIVRAIGAYSGWDGFVNHDDYGSRKRAVADVREAFVQRVAASDEERREWIKAWPFPVDG
ncbi:hypothetical protein CFD26_100335 [Aspergillus turcosus]|uniref:Altered inheritance of mitochondria protein 9, mitochondrial n=1 Tax=Aspergillus turcosus TaxID=1245748 RepID=A0A3R7IDU0_9EURO|nr:hypothetical protein CFD26_100335 [Aspergillus turcosus]